MFNLIVGAGLSGATIARLLADRGDRVLVIDKRPHIAGNAYDYIDKKTGIRVNKYGAHIFHTSNSEVWDFVNKYSSWNDYKHRVLSYVNNKYVPVPINIRTVNMLFGLDIKDEAQMDAYLNLIQIKGDIKNSKDAAISRVGEQLYELMFENYTRKQWDKDPSQLDPSVLLRIPVRNNFNDRYFNDLYEGMPVNGYTELVANILDHVNITVKINEKYDKKVHKADRVIFTGKIDSYFAKKYGRLEYRSLRFKYRTYKKANFQPAAVVNYPSLEYPFTRKVDYKKFYDHDSIYSIIAEEYSTPHGEGYYPVPCDRNKKIYELYKKEAAYLESKNVYFIGRLAEYKYYNMDEAILSAINLYKRFISNNRE